MQDSISAEVFDDDVTGQSRAASHVCATQDVLSILIQATIKPPKASPN